MKKGIFHTSITTTLLLSSSLILSMPVTAQTAIGKLEKSPIQPLESIVKNTISPQKTMGAYSSNRLKGSSWKKFARKNNSRVRLNSKFSRKLGIANYEVTWIVTNSRKRWARYYRGKNTTMHLSPGKYKVTMKIGKFKKSRVIRVRRSRNTVQSFSMPINAGLLKVASGGNAINGSKISVRNSRGVVVAQAKNGRPIRRLLNSGKYTVEVTYGNKSKGRNNIIYIRNGKVKVANLHLPASAKVRLRAFEKGKRPLMRSSKWVVTNSNGNIVFVTKIHSIRKNLLPGKYTAKLTVGGKTQKKDFIVRPGKNQTVTLSI